MPHMRRCGSWVLGDQPPGRLQEGSASDDTIGDGGMNSGRRPFTALARAAPVGIGRRPLPHPRFEPLNIARRYARGDRVQSLRRRVVIQKSSKSADVRNTVISRVSTASRPRLSISRGAMRTVASTAHTAARRVRNSIQPAAGGRPEAVDSRPVTVRNMRRAVHSRLMVVIPTALTVDSRRGRESPVFSMR
jgi:hypothetical protein